jgi:hypothetical protein
MLLIDGQVRKPQQSNEQCGIRMNYRTHKKPDFNDVFDKKESEIKKNEKNKFR